MKMIIFYLSFVSFSKSFAYAQKEIIRNPEWKYQPGMKDPAILITGGHGGDRAHSDDLRSAEIFHPSDNKGCSLPELTEGRRSHTQDGGMACGGDTLTLHGSETCEQWSQGSWTRSHSISEWIVHDDFDDEWRLRHVSWDTASGVYLMGGGFDGTLKTSVLVKENGSVEEGFPLEYDTDAACAIPDPDREEVIVTGGIYTETTVSVYNENGWQGDLAKLTNFGRHSHACSSFTHAGEKHIIVIGGLRSETSYNLDTTEVYSFRDNAWTEAGKLPARMRGMRAATVNNRVLLFGGYNPWVGSDAWIRNDILEYDFETKKWKEIGTMQEARGDPAVSVVEYAEYTDFCYNIGVA